MELSDYLYFGFQVNDTPSKEEAELLIQRLQNWPDDPERDIILRALDNRLARQWKCQPEAVRDDLMELARQWYRMDKNRDAYLTLYDYHDELPQQLEKQPANIRKFHDTLTRFAHSSDPELLVQSLFRVHELAQHLRRYKRMEDWPGKFSSATTVWWFLPLPRT